LLQSVKLVYAEPISNYAFNFNLRHYTVVEGRPCVSVGIPDGLAVDAEGGVWVCLWDAGRVVG